MSSTAVESARAQASSSALTVRPVGSASDVSLVSATLARAFFSDPVFEWVFPDPERRRESVPRALDAYTRAFARHGGTYMTDDASGAILALPPGAVLVEGEDGEAFASELGEIAGADAARMFELFQILDQHHPEADFWMVQILGVDPELQGRGIGSLLLGHVLERADRTGAAAYLEATTEDSARLYERHGFAQAGEIHLPDGPTLYRMWRESSR